METPKMIVDLDDWGEQVIDLNELADISTDYTAELTKQAAQFSYIESVVSKLKLIYAKKNLYLDKFTAQKYREIEQALKEDGGKATVKAIEAALAEDEELYLLKEELLFINNQMDRLKGHLVALGFGFLRFDPRLHRRMLTGDRIAHLNRLARRVERSTSILHALHVAPPLPVRQKTLDGFAAIAVDDAVVLVHVPVSLASA